jgi:hypothetical protein
MIQQRKVQLERPPNKKEFEIIREHVQAQFERVD